MLHTTDTQTKGEEMNIEAQRSSGDVRGARLHLPLTDIMETEHGVELAIEMPGVASENVDISLERRVLTVRGREDVNRLPGFQLGRTEYDQGNYERRFALSEALDCENIEAEFSNGVLSLRLPRVEARSAQRISVKAA